MAAARRRHLGGSARLARKGLAVSRVLPSPHRMNPRILVALSAIFAASSVSAQTPTWKQISTTNPPPFRYSHAMAYVGNGTVVMYGGVYAATRYGDAWSWNGTTWTNHGTTPYTPRHEHAMTYD